LSGHLWIVSAPSGAGKTSLTRALVPLLAKRDIRCTISVSHTTRPPRPGEQNGVHYHFIDEPTFQRMVSRGEFLEHAEVFGRRYGTAREITEKLLLAGQEVLLDIDWQGARQVRSQMREALGIFVLPPSSQELERRLRGRGQDTDAVIADRMLKARAEMSHWAEYEHVIVNADFERALDEMAIIIRARQLRCDAQGARHAELIRGLLEPLDSTSQNR
jgi:guanylate kinase